MTLFYLRSGFVLTLSYGREEWRATTLKADPQEGVFHARSFYWNRAVRIAPLYYLCNALAYWIPGPGSREPEEMFINPRRFIYTLTLTNAQCDYRSVDRDNMAQDAQINWNR